MTEAKKAWDDVVAEISELGRLLRERLGADGEASPGTATGATEGEPTADASGDGRTVADALSGLADAARRLGEQASAAVTDPALRDEAMKVADRLGSAISATVEEMTAGVRTHAQAKRNQQQQASQGPWAEATEAEATEAEATDAQAGDQSAAPEPSRDSPDGG